mmetsp:Transcript_52464/g.123937  ORF Transcript_52464/g.123937 Transcript_52464/m.123937 type:complete len:387 (-) Transcript_52464:260-1420(-)
MLRVALPAGQQRLEVGGTREVSDLVNARGPRGGGGGQGVDGGVPGGGHGGDVDVALEGLDVLLLQQTLHGPASADPSSSLRTRRRRGQARRGAGSGRVAGRGLRRGGRGAVEVEVRVEVVHRRELLANEVRQQRRALAVADHVALGEDRVPVLARREVVLGRDVVARGEVERALADLERPWDDAVGRRHRGVELEADSRHAREAAFELGVHAHAVFEGLEQLRARHLEHAQLVEHRKQRHEILHQKRTRRKDVVGPEGAGVEEDGVDMRAGVFDAVADRVRNPVPGVGLARPDVRKRRVHRAPQLAQHLVHRPRELLLILGHQLSRRRVLGVVLADFRELVPDLALLAASGVEFERELREVAEVGARLDDGHPAHHLPHHLVVVSP